MVRLRTLLYLAVATAVLAAAANLLAVPGQAGGWWASLFFLAVAGGQLLFGARLLQRPRARLIATGFTANLAALGLSAVIAMLDAGSAPGAGGAGGGMAPATLAVIGLDLTLVVLLTALERRWLPGTQIEPPRVARAFEVLPPTLRLGFGLTAFGGFAAAVFHTIPMHWFSADHEAVHAAAYAGHLVAFVGMMVAVGSIASTGLRRPERHPREPVQGGDRPR